MINRAINSLGLVEFVFMLNLNRLRNFVMNVIRLKGLLKILTCIHFFK